MGVATVSGDLDALSTGVVYCELVCALQGLAQYDVAEEWTEAMQRWCKTDAIGSLHGRCRVHRAEILRLRGSCSEAETEALGACEELRPYLRRETGCRVAPALDDGLTALIAHRSTSVTERVTAVTASLTPIGRGPTPRTDQEDPWTASTSTAQYWNTRCAEQASPCC